MIRRDNFTDFTFDGISSKTMKVWITNNHDLIDQITPDMKNDYIAPSYADGRYYTGTSVQQTKITLKCIAINITSQEKRAISRWLDSRAKGKLSFGFDKKHYYEVKVASGIQANKWIKSRYDTAHGGYLYIYEFSITFETIGDYAALSAPLTFDLQFLKHYRGFDQEGNSNFYTRLEKADAAEYEKIYSNKEAEYYFTTTYNDYNLTALNYHDSIFFPAGIYSWQELRQKLNFSKDSWLPTTFYFLRINPLDTEFDYEGKGLPYIEVSNINGLFCVSYNAGMTPIYPSSRSNWVLEDQDNFIAYFPFLIGGIDTAKVGANHTSLCEPRYSICNTGSLPMFYDYFINGQCSNILESSTEDEKISYRFDISIDDVKEYSMGITRPYLGYYYNYNLDSRNGTIINNGSFCENVNAQIYEVNNEKDYYSKGSSSIESGNAETVELQNCHKINPQAFFISSNNNSQLNPYTLIDKDSIVLRNPANTSEFIETSISLDNTGFYTVKFTIPDTEKQADGSIINVLNKAKMKISLEASKESEAKIILKSLIITADKPQDFYISAAKDPSEKLPHIRTGNDVVFMVSFKANKNGILPKIHFKLLDHDSSDQIMKVNMSSTPSTNNWFTWTYIQLDLPNYFTFSHNGLVHLSLFNEVNRGSSAYSIDTDRVVNNYNLDNNLINLTAYAIPYLDRDNNSMIRLICSPIDFIKNSNWNQTNNFINLVVTTDDKGNYSLEPSTTKNKWASVKLFDFNKEHPIYAGYASIGDAHQLDIVMQSSPNKAQDKDLGSILNEHLTIQTREV